MKFYLAEYTENETVEMHADSIRLRSNSYSEWPEEVEDSTEFASEQDAMNELKKLLGMKNVERRRNLDAEGRQLGFGRWSKYNVIKAVKINPRALTDHYFAICSK